MTDRPVSSALHEKEHFSMDAEFWDFGDRIVVLSIALVRLSDGAEMYFEFPESLEENEHLTFESIKARKDHEPSQFQSRYVYPHLDMVSPAGAAAPHVTSRAEAGRKIGEFFAETGKTVAVWAAYGSHDFIALTSLYGDLNNAPDFMPWKLHDFAAIAEFAGVDLPPQPEAGRHHALVDARWGKLAAQALGIPSVDYDPQQDTVIAWEQHEPKMPDVSVSPEF